jgi:two-component system sensor histidine kinase RegB
MVPRSPKAAPGIAFPWIVRLRYAMAAGQIATSVLVDRGLHIDLPLRFIVIAPALVLLSNVWLARETNSGEKAARVPESALIGWLFILDTLCLTVVLMLTGGASNPFSLFYLVHITLSATILTQRQTWALGALSSLCFALLFRTYRPIAELEMHKHGDGVNLHLVGMWVGFSLASLLVTVFSGKISELLRERERSLLLMQEELAKKDRLASLVTLAAGAAHELSTPLGTIAVVANELERYATGSLQDSAVAEDSHLIRTEVERCREILQRLSVEGAEPAGEALENVRAGTLLTSLEEAFAWRMPLRIEAQDEARMAFVRVPRHAVEQALAALVKNAIDASPKGARVSVKAECAGNFLKVAVQDEGTGMSVETLRHAGEPFFTTKEPGKGMGLGIFLVRTLADRLGGDLVYESVEGHGTCATLQLPLATTGARAAGKVAA